MLNYIISVFDPFTTVIATVAGIVSAVVGTISLRRGTKQLEQPYQQSVIVCETMDMADNLRNLPSHQSK